MRLPAAQNFSALSTRLAIARSNSSMSSDATVGFVAAPAPASAPRPAPRRAARSAVRCRPAARPRRASRASAANCGSSSCARSPSDCTSRAALRVLRSATSSSCRSSARAASAAKRASSVSRQAAVAVSGERRSCDRLLTPSRRKWSSRRSASHCRRSASSMLRKPWLSWPNSSLASASGHAPGSVPGAPASRPSRADRGHRLAQPAQRARDHADDPGRQRGGQRHQRDDQPQQRQREAAAQRLDAAFGQRRLLAHQVQVAGHALVVADDGAAQRARGDHRVGVHVLGVVAHHVGHRFAAGRLLHRRQRHLEARRQLARGRCWPAPCPARPAGTAASRARTAPGCAGTRRIPRAGADAGRTARRHAPAPPGPGRPWRGSSCFRARSAGRRTAPSPPRPAR